MSSEPRNIRLDNVAQINPRRQVRKGNSVPFIEMAALPQHSRDISMADISKRAAKSAGAHFQNGDTLLARITPCLENGKTAQVRCLNDSEIGEGSTEFIVLCGIEQEDNDYIYYLCRDPAFREYAISRMEGTSGRQRVSWQSIAGYEFSCPPSIDRRAAARFLTSIDDRIALLRETNATLEAIAQALFKSWFVDFDPVRAKMEGRAPEGMDEATAALFPDSFKESALGLVPRGWSVRTMADISTVGIGKTPPRKEQHWFSENPCDERWVSIRDMGLMGTYASNSNEFLTKEAVDRFNVRRVPDNTVLMSFKFTVGRVAITDGEITTNEAIAHFRLRPDALVTTEYIYLHLKQFDYSKLSSTSSIADAVNSKTVREISILVPSPDVMKAFQVFIKGLFEHIKNAEKQAKTLATLRDTLLPRLISGQLRLLDVSEVIEEAVA